MRRVKNKVYEVVGQPINPDNTYMDTKCIQNGYNLDTQIRIDKIREEENRKKQYVMFHMTMWRILILKLSNILILKLVLNLSLQLNHMYKQLDHA